MCQANGIGKSLSSSLKRRLLLFVLLLLATRNTVGIASQKKFVVARQYVLMNHIDGWQAVRSVARKANLTKSELITSTNIRKELASTLQLQDMNEAKLIPYSCRT